MLDPSYSSAALEVRHDGLRYTRFEKVALVSEWKPALQTLRSCFDAFRSDLNCGECEKCLRTMTSLLIVDRLQDCSTYAFDDLSPGMLRKLQAGPPVRPHVERKQALTGYVYYALGAYNATLAPDFIFEVPPLAVL